MRNSSRLYHLSALLAGTVRLLEATWFRKTTGQTLPTKPEVADSMYGKILLNVFIVIISLFATCSCASLEGHMSDYKEQHANYYPGVKWDAHFIHDCFYPDCGTWPCLAPTYIINPILLPFHILDLPFSAVVDTLFVPFDYYRFCRKEEQDRMDVFCSDIVYITYGVKEDFPQLHQDACHLKSLVRTYPPVSNSKLRRDALKLVRDIGNSKYKKFAYPMEGLLQEAIRLKDEDFFVECIRCLQNIGTPEALAVLKTVREEMGKKDGDSATGYGDLPTEELDRIIQGMEHSTPTP